MVTCRSPARSPLAGERGEGPKHFFQVDSTQREPQSVSAVPPHLVALIEFNVFLRSPFDGVYSLRRWGGSCVAQSLQVTRCQGLFSSLPRTSPVTLRKGATSPGASGARDTWLASVPVLKWQQRLGLFSLLYKAWSPCQSPGRICTSLAFAKCFASLQGHASVPARVVLTANVMPRFFCIATTRLETGMSALKKKTTTVLGREKKTLSQSTQMRLNHNNEVGHIGAD